VCGSLNKKEKVMSIKFHDNFIIAKKVLNAVNKLMPKELQKDCIVEAYANGREQGYNILCIIAFPYLQVSFSGNRNSDDIVVYSGKNFDLYGNIAGNDENRNFFKPNEFENAAKFIIKLAGELLPVIVTTPKSDAYGVIMVCRNS